jgi:hypothetical protein
MIKEKTKDMLDEKRESSWQSNTDSLLKPTNVGLEGYRSTRFRNLERSHSRVANSLGNTVAQVLVDGSKNSQLARLDLGVLHSAYVTRNIVYEVLTVLIAEYLLP